MLTVGGDSKQLLFFLQNHTFKFYVVVNNYINREAVSIHMHVAVHFADL